MNDLWELYKSDTWVEPFLIYSIVAFVSVAGILFLSTILLRSDKIAHRKRYVINSAVIDKILISLIFEDLTYANIKANAEYRDYISKNGFRRQMLKALINLHKNYEGIYAKKLEIFYSESGLRDMSRQKLKSREWQIVCAGIQELAEMKATEVFPELIKISKTRNKTIKIIALKACARLDENKAIVLLKEHNDLIDMWTQVNIISAFERNYTIDEDKNVELLLSSKNTTVISLGLKIIQSLELTNKIPFVMQLIEQAPTDAVRMEAQDVELYLNKKIG